ncbi:MAG: hypothetical protein EOO68_12210, partial [Moraxellaceae bacterium]
MPAQPVHFSTTARQSAVATDRSPWLSMWLKTAMLLLLAASSAVHAAPATVELFAGGGNTTAQGPVTTAQTNTYQANLNNPTDNSATTYSPNTTVTYSLTSRYSTSSYNSAINQPDFVFGGGINTATTMGVRTIYSSLDAIASPSNANFASTLQNAPASCTNGSTCSSGSTGGISVVDNYGSGMFVATRGLSRANLSVNGRHLVGTLTVTFNRPVTNPILHVASLGAEDNGLGFSAEFDLVSNASYTNSVVMSRLAGSSELSVNATQITNNASNIGATTGGGAASGSVYLKGRRITSLTFNVYMRGDGGGSGWERSASTSGDRFFFGV